MSAGHDIEGLAARVTLSPEAIIGIDLDGGITSWNRGAEDLCGFSAAEAVGASVSLVVPPERRGEETRILDRVAAGERIRSLGMEWTAKSGGRVRVTLAASPVEGMDGSVAGVSIVARRATDEQREDQRFRALLESAPDAMVIVGTDGRIVLVNIQAEDIFGYRRDELIGERIETLVPERLRHGHVDRRLRFFLEPNVRPMGAGLELFGRRSDGSEFPVEISLSPIATDDGLLVAAAVRDVTDRKRAEERFRKFLEFAPDAIVMVDDGGTIVEVNSQAVQLFGYSRDELIGEPVETLLPDRFRDGHAGHRGAYFSTAQVRPMGRGLELLGRRRDGTEFPVDISLAPLETEGGLLVSAAIRDVTDRKRADEQSRRLEEMRRRRRQALDLNDEIVQGLAVAQLAHEMGQTEETAEAIERTLRAAQGIVSQMLADEMDEGTLGPGDLRRERAATVFSRDPEE